jgi:phosphoenolpyruvate carboxylase
MGDFSSNPSFEGVNVGVFVGVFVVERGVVMSESEKKVREALENMVRIFGSPVELLRIKKQGGDEFKLDALRVAREALEKKVQSERDFNFRVLDALKTMRSQYLSVLRLALGLDGEKDGNPYVKKVDEVIKELEK